MFLTLSLAHCIIRHKFNDNMLSFSENEHIEQTGNYKKIYELNIFDIGELKLKCNELWQIQELYGRIIKIYPILYVFIFNKIAHYHLYKFIAYGGHSPYYLPRIRH